MTAFVLLALAAGVQRSPDQPLQGTAAKCGSEIPWAKSLKEARQRARKEGRPVAWWVTTVRGSHMDRKRVVEKYVLAGPLMMEGVVKLLSDRFVPLRMAGEKEHRKPFGVAPTEFIEPGLVFFDADLKVLHRVDRISTFSEEWFVHLLRKVLEKAGIEVEERKASPGPARQAILDGRPDPALFEKLEGPEARYFHGVALHLTGRDEEGRAEWQKIREGRWAWKAAAELARDGPFVRGFEVHEKLPDDALVGLPSTTTLPRKEADVARAVGFLLRTQRGGGFWDDSTYNFGGDDSLPNVYVAITALAALALREWGPADRVRGALERAERYLRDERMIAARDTDEIVWAHAYRLLYFARAGDREMMARLVRSLTAVQRRRGIWRHEYSNPFVTATALHVLHEAKKAGADVPDGVIKRGAAALEACRSKRGVFSYQSPGRGASLQGGAGRLPLCESALLLSGRSTPERVAASLESSFKHHGFLERVRKYDDHADEWGNGGFFFWYDQRGRAIAASLTDNQKALAQQKEIVLATQEIDGCWVDSHELGRVYGTAMALLTLKRCGR